MATDYRTMIEAAPEAIIVYTPERFLFLNEFAARRLGSDPASLRGQPIMQFVHAESVPEVVRRLQEVARTGIAGPPMEVRFVSRTGEVIPSEIMSVPIVFDGHPALLGLVRDISRRAAAEQALRESEEKFANAFRQSPHGMAFVDPGGKFIKVNHALCEMLGYTEAELLDLGFTEITHADDVDTDLDQFRRLRTGEIASYHRIKRYHRKDGAVIWVSLGVSAIHDTTGSPIYFIGQMQDITTHREMEEARAGAEHRAGIMETTIAVAHEMNNLLTVLMMNAELLANEAAPEEIPELAAEILAAANRIAGVVQKLRQMGEPASVEYLGKKKMLDLSVDAQPRSETK
jgi:PAS domain S-box-containing protein